VKSVEPIVVAENFGRSVSGVSCDGGRADPSVLLLSALLDIRVSGGIWSTRNSTSVIFSFL